MPNLAKMLKEEITRLARREIKAAISALRKDNATLKRVTVDLKKRLAKVESINKRLVKAQTDTPSDAPAQASNGSKARITGKMVRSIRSRLGLSQGDFARLVGVSGQSVLKWEHAGRLNFRGDTKDRIVAIRQMGKREVKAALERLS